jgi:hypothetical protein
LGVGHLGWRAQRRKGEERGRRKASVGVRQLRDRKV